MRRRNHEFNQLVILIKVQRRLQLLRCVLCDICSNYLLCFTCFCSIICQCLVRGLQRHLGSIYKRAQCHYQIFKSLARQLKLFVSMYNLAAIDCYILIWLRYQLFERPSAKCLSRSFEHWSLCRHTLGFRLLIKFLMIPGSLSNFSQAISLADGFFLELMLYIQCQPVFLICCILLLVTLFCVHNAFNLKQANSIFHLVQSFKEALTEVRFCSRMEELLLKKKSINTGDSLEIHSQKACLFVIL